MPCYRPIACEAAGRRANGKLIIKFAGKQSQNEVGSFKISCGKCLGCSLEKARQWAIRCVHESKMHEESAFITLTYNNEHLPPSGSVEPRPFQLFVKRLRKALKGRKIRYFHCGEYGPKLGRPHYHALIFGYGFLDRVLYKSKPFRWYRSAELEKLWPFGFSTVADVTEASAGYVARYTLKKVYGHNSRDHYKGKHPEYITMSRRPGIGKPWFDKFKSDIYPEGVYINNGVRCSPPKYYDNEFAKLEPKTMEKIKRARKKRAEKVFATDSINGRLVKVSNSDSFRLHVREIVKTIQTQQLQKHLGA